MRTEIRLSGSGGQGLITAGIILARAAAIYDGRYAVQSQSYGPEARGGASKAEVIISDDPINYPKVRAPQVLIALTQEALSKYLHDVRNDAVVIVDSMMVKEPPKGQYKVYSMPIIMSASDAMGTAVSANIITLSVLNTICPLVSGKALQESVRATFPKAVETNMKALEIGVQLASQK